MYVTPSGITILVNVVLPLKASFAILVTFVVVPSITFPELSNAQLDGIIISVSVPVYPVNLPPENVNNDALVTFCSNSAINVISSVIGYVEISTTLTPSKLKPKYVYPSLQVLQILNIHHD